jgi:hypothetical protein
MSRRVVTSRREAAGGGGESIDTFAGRVVKYIPADVVAAWVTVNSLLAPKPTPGATTAGAATTPAQDFTMLWVVFGVFVLLTAIWTWRTTQTTSNAPVAKTQIIISTISFIVWVLGIGGPFESLAFVNNTPAIGGVVLIIWTLVAGMIVPPKSEDPPPAPPAPQ